MPREVQQVLDLARQTMGFARMGQRDYTEGGERRLIGLQTAITYGRSVTLVVQTLKNSVDGFDAWYAPIRQSLADDPVAKWFVDRRNSILKEGTVGETTNATHIEILDDHGISELMEKAPPGTTQLFIGDALGRSGWTVQLPDGTTEQVYFSLPSKIGWSEMNIKDAPGGAKLDDLLEDWLSSLEDIVNRAFTEYGPA